MLVFLVDDDYEDHEIFKMAFEKVQPGFKMVTAENGIEAIDKIKEDTTFQPDIIFLDVNMPLMNGKECLHELRKIVHMQNTPMILYSTHDGQKEINEAKKAGASEFMTKPSSISEFTKALQGIVNNYVKPHT